MNSTSAACPPIVALEGRTGWDKGLLGATAPVATGPLTAPWPVRYATMTLPGRAGLCGVFTLKSWFCTNARFASVWKMAGATGETSKDAAELEEFPILTTALAMPDWISKGSCAFSCLGLLAPVGITLNRDVDCLERALRWVADLAGQQDGAGAGAQHGF